MQDNTQIAPLDTPTCSASLVWNAGPARDGGGTAQREMPEGHGYSSWWDDGDLLLIIVDTNSGPEVSLVRVSADGDKLGFFDPETGDDSWGWTDTDISWWARIMESLPQNVQAVPAAAGGSESTQEPSPPLGTIA